MTPATAFDRARSAFVADHPYPREAADDAWLIEQAGDALADAAVKLVAAFGGKTTDYVWMVCDEMEHGDLLKAAVMLRLSRQDMARAA